MDEDERNKPVNIRQAQSTANPGMQLSNDTYHAPSTLTNVHNMDKDAVHFARENKVDLNFALWVGMTGRNKADYVQQY